MFGKQERNLEPKWPELSVSHPPPSHLTLPLLLPRSLLALDRWRSNAHAGAFAQHKATQQVRNDRDKNQESQADAYSSNMNSPRRRDRCVSLGDGRDFNYWGVKTSGVQTRALLASHETGSTDTVSSRGYYLIAQATRALMAESHMARPPNIFITRPW